MAARASDAPAASPAPARISTPRIRTDSASGHAGLPEGLQGAIREAVASLHLRAQQHGLLFGALREGPLLLVQPKAEAGGGRVGLSHGRTQRRVLSQGERRLEGHQALRRLSSGFMDLCGSEPDGARLVRLAEIGEAAREERGSGARSRPPRRPPAGG